MPAEGIEFSHNKELLSWDEMFLLASTFIELGITKIRITGGEPFVRKGLMDFLHRLAAVKGLEEISITTNATLIGEHIAALKALGILNINVSMDSLDKERFNAITRRNYFDVVYSNVLQLLQNGFNVKINCVVMNGLNTDDILPFIEFAHEQNVSVRFLEEMPFNGHSKGFEKIEWDFLKIMDHIQQHFPGTHRMNDGPSSTSENYTIENRRGSFGIIPSFSRTFCGTCNRIRVSAKGELQTCLYTNESVSFKKLLQQTPHPDLIKPFILKAIHNRFKDGFEAEEKNEYKKSMSLIGG
jgi:cyclic pyranopterin phosphate synthase